MDSRDVEKLLQRYADALPDADAMARMRPEVKEKLAGRPESARRRMVHRYLKLGLFGGIPLSIAAVLLFLLTPGADLGLSVSIAGRPSDLFVRRVEQAPLHDQFWVGIRVRTPSWVHLIERTENGYLVISRPQRTTDRYAYHVSGRAELGPFSLVEANTPTGPSALTHLLVVASEGELSGERLADAVPDRIAVNESDEKILRELYELANILRRQFNWVVDVRALPRPAE
mgnify:CR=1 FL=1